MIEFKDWSQNNPPNIEHQKHKWWVTLLKLSYGQAITFYKDS